jgi:hypothetical protein
MITKKEAQEKALEILKKNKTDYAFRSCWKCNPCHKHLKKVDLLRCFNCGHWYYKGIDITED